MSRKGKRRAPPPPGSIVAQLVALKPNDKDRPAVAAAVLARLKAGQLSEAERLAASAALTPADWRAQQPSAAAAERYTDGQPVTVTARPTLARDHFAFRRTATLDSRGWIWNADAVRVHLRAAMDTMRRMRFPAGEVPSTRVAACIEFARSMAELLELLREGEGDIKAMIAAPTPAELRALDDTLPWLFAVPDWRYRMAASLRASGMSWRKVAEKVSDEIERRTGGDGISYETARRWESEAVGQIVKALNAGSRKHSAAA